MGGLCSLPKVQMFHHHFRNPFEAVVNTVHVHLVFSIESILNRVCHEAPRGTRSWPRSCRSLRIPRSCCPRAKCVSQCVARTGFMRTILCPISTQQATAIMSTTPKPMVVKAIALPKTLASIVQFRPKRLTGDPSGSCIGMPPQRLLSSAKLLLGPSRGRWHPAGVL